MNYDPTFLELSIMLKNLLFTILFASLGVWVFRHPPTNRKGMWIVVSALAFTTALCSATITLNWMYIIFFTDKAIV